MPNAEPKVSKLPPRLEPTPEELAQLKEKWGDVLRMQLGDSAIVVRRFNEVEWDRFQSAAERSAVGQQGADVVRATKDLLAACVVWQSEPLDLVYARRPTYGKRYAMGLIDWAGAGDELKKNEL
jgi:hypothetical protein